MFNRMGALLWLGVLCAPLLGGCTGESDGAANAGSRLSAAQCDYFAVGGRVTICHATGSRTNPFTLIRVAESACVNAHAGHAGDYVSTDGTCGPNACLPIGGPVDATLGCCPGLAPDSHGICQDVNECATNNGGCVTDAVCTNTPGSRTCACRDGYTDCGGACLLTGGACSVGTGACLRSGTTVCGVGATTCSATAGTPTMETCNNVDDDCDGATDEDFDTLADVNNCGMCGVRCAVANGTPACAAGTCGVARCDTGYTQRDGACVDIDECAAQTACFWDVGAQSTLRELAGTVANPNGAWSFFYQPGGAFGTLAEYISGAPVLYTAADHDAYVGFVSQNLRGYVRDYGGSTPFALSYVGADGAAPWSNVNHGDLVYHPGPPSTGGRYNTVRWTAPAAGTFEVNAAWRIVGGAAADFAMLRDHAGSAIVTGRTSTTPTGYTGTLTLTAGATLEFVVGLGADHAYTTTGLTVRIRRTDGACPGTCADGNHNGVCDDYEPAPPPACSAGYTCVNLPGSYRCDSPCASNPCLNGGTCTVGGSGYTCTCTSAFTGARCESSACPAVDPEWARWHVRDASSPAFDRSVDGTVLDPVTGLRWEQSVTTSVPDVPTAAAHCAGLTLGGLGDWRLPTIAEAESIIDFSQSPMAIYAAFTEGSSPWVGTATTSLLSVNAGYSFVVTYENGGRVQYAPNSEPRRARCVRDERPLGPTCHYRTNPSGTVLDNLTGLTWTQAPVSTGLVIHNRAQAAAMCSGLTTDGAAWHLPSVAELFTLVNYRGYNSAIDMTVFSEPWQYAYETSTIVGSNFWTVSFRDGASTPYASSAGWDFIVRCVR